MQTPKLRRRTAARIPPTPMRLGAAWPLEMAVLFVAIPRWTRPNIYVTAHDEPAHHPLAERMIHLRLATR